MNVLLKRNEVVDRIETCPNCEDDFCVDFWCKKCWYWVLDKEDELDNISNIIWPTWKKIAKIISKNEINYEFLVWKIISYKILLYDWKIKSIKIKINWKKYIIFLDKYDFEIKKTKYRHLNETDSLEQNISSINIKDLKIFFHEKLSVWSKQVYINPDLYKQVIDFTSRLLKNYHNE